MRDAIQSPKLSKRSHAILNAVAFCFEQIEKRYEALCGLILACNDEGYNCHDVIAAAWDLIDWVERLRKLLAKGAGIKKREEWYQSAIRTLAPAEELRHSLQHFDGSVEESLAKNVSIFGYVTAYYLHGAGYSIVVAASVWERPGALGDSEIWLKTKIDFHPPVDQIVLSVGGRKAHLTNLMLLVRKTRHSFEDFVRRTYQEDNQPGTIQHS